MNLYQRIKARWRKWRHPECPQYAGFYHASGEPMSIGQMLERQRQMMNMDSPLTSFLEKLRPFVGDEFVDKKLAEADDWPEYIEGEG